MTLTYVRDCNDIDLDRHAFIEASAGTGKTYTIENLVVRLLMEKPDLELSGILLVTFTEKATSELRQRIQEKLESHRAAVAGDPLLVKKISATLDAFDTASIYTIHGFCQTVLRDFAFENGALFSHEVIDDGPLFTTLLKEQMRKDWPRIYGASLRTLLSVSNFSGRKDTFLDRVSTLARNVRPEYGDDIRPDITGRTAESCMDAVLLETARLKTLVTPSFLDRFEKLNLKKKPKALLGAFLRDIGGDACPTDRVIGSLLELEMFSDTPSDDPWPKNRKKNIEACPGIDTVLDVLPVLYEESLCLAHLLTLESMERLKADAAIIKQQNGWISYDDMIGRLNDALAGPGAEALLERLRRQYRVAFVDEFQDTDAAQWAVFSRIFLDAPEGGHPNRLYLIGDPKQAIYAFRGADVFVYLEAKERLARLAGQGRARLYSLATNWRSRPELIAAFNRLFGQDAWFVPQARAGAFDIGYQDVGFPDEADRPERLVNDRSGRPPLTIFDISRHTQAGQVKADLADAVTREIVHLISCGGMDILKKNGMLRPLDYGDICILVRGKSDMEVLEPFLSERRIPYTYYRKPGLFLSDEALFLSCVFQAVLDPSDTALVRKALLTPFFDVYPEVLDAYDHQPVTHPVKKLLYAWNGYATKRRWSLLFQSLMEDSGLVFRHSADHDWDRRETNYRQIFEHLTALAYRKNLDFQGLSAQLDRYIARTSAADDDADIHQIETEDRKVQVMTMHVSKGLQFPIVFVAGGLGRSNTAEYYQYHLREEGSGRVRKVVDLTKRTGKDLHDQERWEEDKRLFYVALTRARFKLYVPRFDPLGSHRLDGPVSRIITPSLDAAFAGREGQGDILWLDAADAGSDSGLTAPPAPAGAVADQLPELLPRALDYRNRRRLMESFSSLHGRKRAGDETVFHARLTEPRDDEEHHAAPPSFQVPAVTAGRELPGGAETGSMLHDILETIDFKAVARHPDRLLAADETRLIIDRAMQRYGMDRAFRDEVARIIADTITAPIPPLGDSFCLGDLTAAQRLHEVEFVFPMPGALPDVSGLEPSAGGYIRGFIDLIFRAEGRFYIADWKSNRLERGYDAAAMEQSMGDADYHLQYTIYTLATLRWLEKCLGPSFDRTRHFGGIFYFYLRGMGKGNGQGIYHVPPEKVTLLSDLERAVAAAAQVLR
ncbi:hypothetical protein JCM14469_37450 [Desulfatiferula olefinivorans]